MVVYASNAWVLMMKTNNRDNSTAAAIAEGLGVDSLQTVVQVTGVSRHTLRNWSINKPELFRIVVTGVYFDGNRPDTRVLDLVKRLTAPGKAGAALSASEMHEIADYVTDLHENGG